MAIGQSRSEAELRPIIRTQLNARRGAKETLGRTLIGSGSSQREVQTGGKSAIGILQETRDSTQNPRFGQDFEREIALGDRLTEINAAAIRPLQLDVQAANAAVLNNTRRRRRADSSPVPRIAALIDQERRVV